MAIDYVKLKCALHKITNEHEKCYALKNKQLLSHRYRYPLEYFCVKKLLLCILVGVCNSMAEKKIIKTCV